MEEPETFSSQDLFRDHEAFISVVAKLIESSYRRAVAAQNQIDQRSERLVKQSAAFLAAFLIAGFGLHRPDRAISPRNCCAKWNGRRAN